MVGSEALSDVDSPIVGPLVSLAAKSELNPRDHFCDDDWSDAAGSYHLLLLMEGLEDLFKLRDDSHLSSLYRVVAQILPDSESPRHKDNIKVIGLQLGKGGDLPPANPGRLLEDVSGLSFHGCSSNMVDNVHLIAIRSEEGHLVVKLMESKDDRRGFQDLGSVVDSGSRKDNSSFMIWGGVLFLGFHFVNY